MNLDNLLSDDIAPDMTEWAAIQLKIGSLSPQYINIGIAYKSNNGFVDARLLDNLAGFKCMLGASFNEWLLTDMIGHVASALECKVSSLADIKLPSPTVRLSTPGFIQSVGASAAFDMLWSDVVTIDHSEAPARKRAFKPFSNTEVRESVFSRIIKRSALQHPNFIFPEKKFQIQTDDEKTLLLDVPLVTHEGVGSLISACYATWDSIERNIYTAMMDINAAAQFSERNARAIFLKKPESVSGIPEKNLDQIDKMLDEAHHKLKTSGVFVGVEEDDELLAEEIERWAHDHA